MKSLLRFSVILAITSAGMGCGGALMAQGASRQMVRLSAVQGDVRVTRGERDEQEVGPKAEAAAWSTAEANMTLEPGYSLATGAGQAEITFADGSTLTLEDNSLLSFGNVSRKGNAMREPVDLVSGTLSLDVHSVKGGWFRVTTPTDQMVVKYPEHARMRVDSYLDGMALMGFDATNVQVGSAKVTAAAGEQMLFRKGRSIDPGLVQPRADEFTGPSGSLSLQAGLMPVRPPRIFPRTVAQSAFAEAQVEGAPGAATLGFDRRSQVFTLSLQSPRVATGSQIVVNYNYSNTAMDRPGQPVAIGGGPSAIREGKGGSMGRVDHSYGSQGSIGPYQSMDPTPISIP